MTRRSLHAPARRHRPAFTLIEILVVVSIIAVLMTLSAAAVMRFLKVQYENNTKTILTKVGNTLNNRWNAAKDHYLKEQVPSALSAQYAYILNNMAQGDANRARVIWVKFRLQQTFPMSFNEALVPAVLDPTSGLKFPALPAYSSYLQSIGAGSGSTAQTAPYEAAACLLMALQRAEGGGGINLEDLGAGATADSPAGGPSFKYLVDAWGKPLSFCRWPTASTVLNPTGASAGFKDPLDPQGYLASPGYLNTNVTGGAAANFASKCHALPAPPPAITFAKSFYIVPLVISLGPNAVSGQDSVQANGVAVGPHATEFIYNVAQQ